MTARLSSIRAAVLFAAAILLLALAPAVTAQAEDCGTSNHPSGNDRCVEEGGSGTQGSATSDPDDDGNGPDRTNGGVDQDGGDGGVNQQDQDGNNGCGNDQDFEDDNEGLCDGSQPDTPETVLGEDAAKDSDGKDGKDDTDKRTDDDKGDTDDDEDGQGTDGRDDHSNGGGEKAEEPAVGAVLGNGAARADEAGLLGGVSDARSLHGAAAGGDDAVAAGAGSGALAAIGSAADTLAATGIGGLALALLALGSIGLGALTLRRSRAGR